VTFHLRDLKTIDDCRQVAALEKDVWRYPDPEDVVPPPVLMVSVKRGGILIGAFDDEERMAGFVYSLPGIKNGRAMQWSHMLGVLEQHRGSGVGYELKLAQRNRALAMGMDLIEWTFDPLQAANAHLNFRKLGVTADEYAENIYGDSSSILHRGTPTDRLIVQWRIADGDVASRLDGALRLRSRKTGEADIRDAVPVNVTRNEGEWLTCERYDLGRTEPRLTIEIPASFTKMQVDATPLAAEWRTATRALFSTYFARGYRALDFTLDRAAGRGWYSLSREAR
jgi:predicted GNAT superfamily acetyltransferase